VLIVWKLNKRMRVFNEPIDSFSHAIQLAYTMIAMMDDEELDG
jgi:hypothetical protein